MASGPSTCPPRIWPRSGHFRQEGGIDGRLNGRIDRFDGGENPHPRFQAQGKGEVDGVLADIDLGGEIRRDVDGGVRHHQRFVPAGNVHDEDMGEAPANSQAALLVEHRLQQIVRMQVALHDRARPALMNKLAGPCGGGRLAAGLDDLEGRGIDVDPLGRRRDQIPGADQNRRDEPFPRRKHGTLQRIGLGRPDHGGAQRGRARARSRSASK